MADELISEEWRPVEGHPGYEVSSLGRVKSLDRNIRGSRNPNMPRRMRGKILTPILKDPGYYTVALPNHIPGKDSRTHRIHVLVCTAFHGPRPTLNHEVAHNDGTRTNNAEDNLCWKTHAENEQDKLIHGTHNRGQRHPLNILTTDQIIEIRNLIGAVSQRRIAQLFGISQQHVSNIKNKKAWHWMD